MKKKMIILTLSLALAAFACNRKPKTSCVYGDSIPINILDPAVKTGEQLISEFESGKFDQLYDAGCDYLKKAQTREQFKMVLQGINYNLSNLEPAQLNEAYYMKNEAGKKTPVVDVACNLEEENINDLYQAPANSELMSLIYNSKSGGESVHIFLELIKQGGDWKLFTIVPGLGTLKGKTVDDYVDMARKAREAGKPRIALLYYKIAFLLADLSPNVIEFVSRKIGEEMGQVKTDFMPQSAPQVWTSADNSRFEVYNVDPFIDRGDVWVNVDWLVDSFADTQKVDADSQKLLDFALEKFPETREFFTGIMVSAHSRDRALANQAYRKLRRFEEAPK